MNTQSLMNLFSEQKSNIASAMPSGFSLSDIPGLALASSTVRTAAREVEAGASSMMRWLLPLAGVAALAALLWMFLATPATRTPEVPGPGAVTRAQSPEIANAVRPDAVAAVLPEVNKLKSDLTETFSKLTEAITSVKDAESAEIALPKLQELEGKLDIAKTTMKDFGTTSRTTITTLVKASEGRLRDLIEKVLAIPNVSEKFKVVTESILKKMTDLTV
jgi:hypothetical protein